MPQVTCGSVSKAVCGENRQIAQTTAQTISTTALAKNQVCNWWFTNPGNASYIFVNVRVTAVSGNANLTLTRELAFAANGVVETEDENTIIITMPFTQGAHESTFSKYSGKTGYTVLSLVALEDNTDMTFEFWTSNSPTATPTGDGFLFIVLIVAIATVGLIVWLSLREDSPKKYDGGNEGENQPLKADDEQ